jgi:hypothetical protein
MTSTKKFLAISGAMAMSVGIAQCGGNNNTTTMMDMATEKPDMESFVAPTITSVTPAISINNAPTSLTITGTGFRTGATVTVGGVVCANPAITATSVSCTLPAKAATCGAQAVVVTNSDNQTAQSANGFSFFTSMLTLNPASTPTVAVQTNPDRTVIGDFNGDGKPDIVTVNQTSDSISLSLGNGDGTFQAAMNTATKGMNSRDLTVGDVNGDGKLDVVVVSPSNTIISTFLGNGDGTLQAVKTAATPSGCNTVVLADVNGDNKLDVLIGDGSKADVYVMLGNGDGTYAAAKTNAVNGITGIFGLSVTDSKGN